MCGEWRTCTITKMAELSTTLYKQMIEEQKLDAVIRKNLKDLGYG